MKCVKGSLLLLMICFVFAAAAQAAENKAAAAPPAKPSEKHARKGPLEKELATITDIGNAAEDAYDYAVAGRWKAVSGKIRHIRQLMLNSNTARMFGGDDAKQINGALDAIDKAAASKNRKSAIDAANQLTLIGIKMAGRYSPAIPVGIEMLDYYGRELQIGVATKDTARVKATIKDIRTTWDLVKGPVRERGGVVEEKAFSLIVAGLEKAGSNDGVLRLCPRLLEQVDRLENLF